MGNGSHELGRLLGEASGNVRDVAWVGKAHRRCVLIPKQGLPARLSVRFASFMSKGVSRGAVCVPTAKKGRIPAGRFTGRDAAEESG